MSKSISERIIESRSALMEMSQESARAALAAEGGCGVLGLASKEPVAGRHVLTASRQMHNRGNGKGGGIAMAGLDPDQMRVDLDTLRSHTLLQVALLDPAVRDELEAKFITPNFDIAQAYAIDHVDDYRAVEGLELRPPEVWRYFLRVKPAVLARFAEEKDLSALSSRQVEDEFVYQNSFRLNQAYYASAEAGGQRAFVLSHGRDLLVLKIVGYAEQVVEYYRLEEQVARIWIAHQRYPTKGRVWHPGGAHPFIGLNEALVHNGDFANYHAVSEYLRQRNIAPLFLTDTEVSVQLFDLWDRVYKYPLEVTLEAMAPTTEHDFAMLTPEKQKLYRAVQRTHLHASPDGPWFFIVARSQPDEDRYDLLGITDTSMLRPQVFALYENSPPDSPPHRGGRGAGVQIGLIASERQAINACLRSLAAEDGRYKPQADRYWVARGGSHTDGGAFRFSVSRSDGLTCADKFGRPVSVTEGGHHLNSADLDAEPAPKAFRERWKLHALHAHDDGGPATFWSWLYPRLSTFSWGEADWGLDWLERFGRHGDAEWRFALETLSRLRDRVYDPGEKRRASLLSMVDKRLAALLGAVPSLDKEEENTLVTVVRLAWDDRVCLRPPVREERILVLDASIYPPEGDDCAARYIARAYEMGWRHFLAYNWRGGRFAGTGLGSETAGVRIDLYGDAGDYAGSGIDGAEVHLHGAGQDQLGQIIKSGKLVVYGDVGQTFLYGAKGGEIYVQGSAAGRPLINAVGRPRAVINGTCLDYLAESFMAGDPLNGGGFVVLNGIDFDEKGSMRPLESPYPGGNLFSLASGGAIYLRDPEHRVSAGQLNGGRFAPLSEADWELILPYLEENERLFGISIQDLLTVDGVARPPADVYRKVEVS